MENAPRACRFRAPVGLAALALALTSGAAFAGSDSVSFGVGLRITASCEVDSAAAVDPARKGAPQVRCGVPTPRVVRITRELPLQVLPEPAAAPAEVRVVTLIF